MDQWKALIDECRSYVRSTRVALESDGEKISVRCDGPSRLKFASASTHARLPFAIAEGRLDALGIDLVHRCANGLLEQGAFASAVSLELIHEGLSLESAETFLMGAARACRGGALTLLDLKVGHSENLANSSFVATVFGLSQLPFDWRPLEPARPGDVLVGLVGTGIGGNLELIQSMIESRRLRSEETIPACEITWGGFLCVPQKNFEGMLRDPIGKRWPHGLVQIADDGLHSTLRRRFPDMTPQIDARSWPIPAAFTELHKRAQLSLDEMIDAFSMGIGFVVVVPPEQVKTLIDYLGLWCEPCWPIGKLIA